MLFSNFLENIPHGRKNPSDRNYEKSKRKSQKAILFNMNA
jgi:hypothetical protein